MGSSDFDLPFASVRGLLLDLARERSLNPLLDLVVRRLAEHPDVALARIWLVREGDVCGTCPMRADCPGQVPCLHLVVSAGQSRVDPDADWSRLGGDFRRFPIGQRKVGSVAATREAICVEDAREDSTWIARPDWARNEGILGFGGQPLEYHGEALGVLGVFTRARFVGAALDSLRMLADHAAAAIANARAFDENVHLRHRLELENEYLREEISESQAFGEILGGSPAIRQLHEQIQQVATTDASVLVLGESGTGKELVAREIHRRSARADRPMIRVNCASVPKELYEGEFFGRIKGAFTGAIKDRQGRFAAADGGTLFLDEVGEIPDYPAAFVSDGVTMITLWQAEGGEEARPFDRKGAFGLHHLALRVDDEVALKDLHERLRARDDVQIEFAPEPLGDGPTHHMMTRIPGNLRVEFIGPAS